RVERLERGPDRDQLHLSRAARPPRTGPRGARAQEGGVMGFHFRETMAGPYTRAGTTDSKRISFTVTARARSWLRHLRDHEAQLEGTVQMDGFASGAPLAGTLYMSPVLGRVIRYQFAFTADDGRPYTFRGQKDVSLFDVVGTMTTLPATITDESGRTVATALLKFDVKKLAGFLGSFRPGALGPTRGVRPRLAPSFAPRE